MANKGGFKQLFLAYGVKILVPLFVAAGICLSALAANSCEFIYYIQTNVGLPGTRITGSFGIFGHASMDGIGGIDTRSSDGCVPYDLTFAEKIGYPTLATAQLSISLSLIMVVIGIFATLVDHCLRSIFASSRIQSSIFLVASGISAGTLILLTDPACYSDDMELKCSVGDGAFYSIGSTVLYFISSLLLSWIPLQAKDQHNEDLNFVTQTRTSSESKSEIFEEPTFAHADTIHTEISPGEIFSENV